MTFRLFSVRRHLRSFVSLGIVLISGLVQGCQTQSLSWPVLKSQIRNEFPAVEHISITEFEQHLENAPTADVLIVDVRAPEEFAVSHLKGAVNLEEADAIVALAQQRQVEQVVIYCSVGYRSARMADALEQQGWDAVVNLEGSIFEWANSGRTVFVGDEPVEVVHPFDPEWGQLLDAAYHPAV